MQDFSAATDSVNTHSIILYSAEAVKPREDEEAGLHESDLTGPSPNRESFIAATKATEAGSPRTKSRTKRRKGKLAETTAAVANASRKSSSDHEARANPARASPTGRTQVRSPEVAAKLLYATRERALLVYAPMTR